MSRLACVLLLAACGEPLVTIPGPTDPEPAIAAAAPPLARVRAPHAPPRIADRNVEVRVGDTGYCTRSLRGAVQCFQPDVPSGETFTVVESGARALAVVPVLIYGDDLEACALLDEGRIECATSWRHQSLQIDGAVDIAFGPEGLCALTGTGAVLCRYVTAPELRRIEGIDDAVQLTGGFGFGCARERTGSVKCWGSNRTVPSVPESTAASSITAGVYHLCATRADGVNACWAASDVARPPPPRVGPLAGAYESTCWLDADAHVQCYLRCHAYQPQLPALEQIAGGGYGVCGLDSNGAVHCDPFGWPQ